MVGHQKCGGFFYGNGGSDGRTGRSASSGSEHQAGKDGPRMTIDRVTRLSGHVLWLETQVGQLASRAVAISQHQVIQPVKQQGVGLSQQPCLELCDRWHIGHKLVQPIHDKAFRVRMAEPLYRFVQWCHRQTS